MSCDYSTYHTVVDLDPCLERLGTDALRGGPDVRKTPEAIFQAPVGSADHVGVETGAGHDGEPLAIDLAHVELPVAAVEPDVHRLLDVGRDVQARCEQVGRARRNDRKGDAAANESDDLVRAESGAWVDGHQNAAGLYPAHSTTRPNVSDT